MIGDADLFHDWCSDSTGRIDTEVNRFFGKLKDK
jgi:hypothetical protein